MYKKRSFIKVPIGPTETIRHRLDLSYAKFGEALGYSHNYYGGAIKEGKIAKTAALAAEALMRRQHASGEKMDTVYILRIIKGTPTATSLNDLQKIVLNGEEFLLVPSKLR